MEITRGDTGAYKFQRINENDEPILETADNVYFTVKPDAYTQKPIFQKTINDMTFDEEGWYHFTINPEDTNNLTYGDYFYDIEVKVGDNYTQTISKGTLSITKEATHKSNEV